MPIVLSLCRSHWDALGVIQTDHLNTLKMCSADWATWSYADVGFYRSFYFWFSVPQPNTVAKAGFEPVMLRFRNHVANRYPTLEQVWVSYWAFVFKNGSQTFLCIWFLSLNSKKMFSTQHFHIISLSNWKPPWVSGWLPGWCNIILENIKMEAYQGA